MWGKPARDLKLRWYPAIGLTLAAVVCLVSGWVVFARLTARNSPLATLDFIPSPISEPAKAADNQSAAPASNLPVAVPAAQTEAVKPPAGAASIRQGVLRVGNPTDYPVRVALLAKKLMVETASSTAKSDDVGYDLPAHWDFAPEEGGGKGLVVSLPDRNLKVKKGDVLVAFAQDGSGRYWGPYVVGETPLPVWNPKTAEWQLILQP